MVIEFFPPVETTDKHGLLAIGGDLEVESLLLAYSSGIFPWPIAEEEVIPWFAPPKRAILRFSDFHIPKTLSKLQKNNSYTFKINNSFSEVIKKCGESSNRESPGETWITPEMIQAYTDFHHAGYAHSVECYDKDRLVGGLYGVSIGAMFAGESMFYEEPNTSKLCLCYLVDYLTARGVTWIDCQQMTPLFKSFGAIEIPREEFQELIAEAIKKPAIFKSP